jgi:hypothetical protein
MSTRTNKLRSDVAESVGALIADPYIRSRVMREIRDNVPNAANPLPRADGANMALRRAEPIIEELEAEAAVATGRGSLYEQFVSRCGSLRSSMTYWWHECQKAKGEMVIDTFALDDAEKAMLADKEAKDKRIEELKAEVDQLKAADKEKRLYELLKQYDDDAGIRGKATIFSDKHWHVTTHRESMCETMVCNGGGGLSACVTSLEKLIAEQQPKEPTPEEVIANGSIAYERIVDGEGTAEDRKALCAVSQLAKQLLAEKRERETVVGVDPGAAEGSRSVVTIVEREPEIWPEYPQWWEDKITNCPSVTYFCFTSPDHQIGYNHKGQSLGDDSWGDEYSIEHMRTSSCWRRIPVPEWAKEKEAVT